MFSVGCTAENLQTDYEKHIVKRNGARLLTAGWPEPELTEGRKP